MTKNTKKYLDEKLDDLQELKKKEVDTYHETSKVMGAMEMAIELNMISLDDYAEVEERFYSITFAEEENVMFEELWNA